ncbi:TonB-dependent receptor [Shinella yambaruensis]|uniref:TonB-dependent receptor n=1 Tax=Shinella yambaruensis TaxID=415996 RepID=A0ABQ5ZMS4_9HYPH|nr:TonB-dependent receptor [Shinella yambaruensis]MCJ8029619.1 TonB-dependent receptor [Shinella yambaruensis]MCU7983895.1 TonB-dependent receptor [Shinella yambaruensis]GLR54164.1 TonB-dependent receptor [Shinella yambaruensis]
MPPAQTEPRRTFLARTHAATGVKRIGAPTRRARLLAGVVFTVTMAAAGSALAQDVREEDKTDRVTTSQTQAADGSTTLEAITVEARRYAENPLDVPVSVSVVTDQKLTNERINDVQDLSDRVVGLQIPNYGDDPRTAQPIVRGVGTLSTLLSPDNSTAPTIIDGVPMPAFAASGQMLDVGQIDVLRGPQGTLFGRNSTGGAINITSMVPDAETIRQITAEVGTEGYRKGEFILGGAINEELFGRFAVRYQGRGAYVKNDHPGEKDIGGFDVGAIKSTLLWTPGDTTEVKLTLGYEKYDGDTGYPYLLRDSHAYQETPEFRRDLGYVTLNTSHDFETFALKTTTGFTYYDIYNWTDNSDGYINSATFGAFGMVIPPEFYTNDGEFNVTDQRESQFYQEVRLQSLDDSETKWVVGGVFSYNDFHEDAFGTSTMSASINGTRDVNLTSTSSAIFFDIAQPFAERFEIGGGLRYTHERKKIDALYTGTGFPGTVASFAQDSARNFDMFSGRVSLSYKLNDENLIYGSVSRGNKAGGFPRFTGNAAIGLPEDGYDATSIWTYEVGWKGDLIDSGTSFAVAGFYNDVTDEAIFGFDPATMTFPIENFDLKTYGVEAEVRKEFDNGFGVFAGVTLTHSEITGIPAGGVLQAKVGNEVPNVPLWSANLGLTYQGEADFLNMSGDPMLTGYLGYRFVGKRAGDTGNNFDLDAQHIIDARVGLKIDQTEFYVFGENLIGDRLEQQGAHMTANINSVLVSRGRTIGLGITTRF